MTYNARVQFKFSYNCSTFGKMVVDKTLLLLTLVH